MKRIRLQCGFAALVLGTPGAIRAQSQVVLVARATAGWSRIEATITGRVTGLRGAGLGGARVTVLERSSVRVATTPSGEYRVVLPADSLTPPTVTVVATAPGYSPVKLRLILGAGPQEANFNLPSDPLGRDTPIETLGQGGAPARLLPFGAGGVTGSELEEVPATTAAGGLAGRIAGVRMIAPSGNPGSDPVLRLRGATSIGGSTAPLVVIDGSIAGTNLADFSPEDIDRIEVAKGPAAAAIFGSNAANGVVQILTKRGRELAEGTIAFSARNELGQSTARPLRTSSGAHPFQLAAGQGGAPEFRRDSEGNRLLEPDGIADNAYPATFDRESAVFGSGSYRSNHLAFAGRRGPRNFRLSFQNTRSEGVVFGLPGFNRQNYRFNLDQRLGKRADLELSGAYTNSSDRDTQQEVGGPFFSWRFLEPSVDLLADNPDGTPYRAAISDRLGNAANPLYRLTNQVRNTDRSRRIGGGVLRWRATDWLTAEGGYHVDRERRDFSDLTPAGFLNTDGNPAPGLYLTDNSAIQRFNVDGTVVAVGHWRAVTSTTRAGFIYEDEFRKRRTRAASSPAADATEFSASVSLTGFHSSSLFAETALQVGGRWMLDALARRETVSMLALGVKTPWYYRVAFGWKLFGETMVRVAYGTTGLRSALNFALVGTDVAPEGVRAPYAAELELGGHIGTPGGRFALDYSFSRKRIRNQVGIASLQLPAGFVEAPANIGAIESRTHELALGLVLVEAPAVQWSVSLAGDRSRGEITEYLLPESLAASAFQPPAFLQAKGSGLGVMFGTRAVRTIDQLYDDPAKASRKGPGEAFDPAKFVLNEAGYVVERDGWRTGDERPITYVTCTSRDPGGACTATTSLVQIGDGTPDFVAGLGTRFAWKGLGLSGLLAWSQGGDIYNGTRQWPFVESRDPVFDQRNKPEAEKKPTAFYRAFFNGLNPHAYFVESGTFVKVREIALTYTFRRQQLGKIGLGGMERLKLGLVGRNLFTFTQYSGEDPEVSTLSGDPFQRRIDWFGYPHFRTLSGVVEISF